MTTTTTTTTDVNNTYNVQVEACNKNFPLRENCQQYGSVYKPVGELQRNGEKMRFGVFAYYNSTDIDNAVMRSKLKYVGPRKYSGSLGFVEQPQQGVEPDRRHVRRPIRIPPRRRTPGAAQSSNSGVINYLNKFGRQSGSYKSNDNFGKMYYESLRYLRKLPPTAGVLPDSRRPANNDDFPVITDWYRTMATTIRSSTPARRTTSSRWATSSPTATSGCPAGASPPTDPTSARRRQPRPPTRAA